MSQTNQTQTPAEFYAARSAIGKKILDVIGPILGLLIGTAIDHKIDPAVVYRGKHQRHPLNTHEDLLRELGATLLNYANQNASDHGEKLDVAAYGEIVARGVFALLGSEDFRGLQDTHRDNVAGIVDAMERALHAEGHENDPQASGSLLTLSDVVATSTREDGTEVAVVDPKGLVTKARNTNDHMTIAMPIVPEHMRKLEVPGSLRSWPNDTTASAAPPSFKSVLDKVAAFVASDHVPDDTEAPHALSCDLGEDCGCGRKGIGP